MKSLNALGITALIVLTILGFIISAYVVYLFIIASAILITFFSIRKFLIWRSKWN